jgi:hypothetical protein
MQTERRRGQVLPAKPDATWLRKSSVAGRYGISERSVDRKVDAGKLPRPKFPIGKNLPLWSRLELEAHDEQA